MHICPHRLHVVELQHSCERCETPLAVKLGLVNAMLSAKKYLVLQKICYYSGRGFRLKWTFKKREEDSKHVHWNAATTLCKDMTRFTVVSLQ